MRRLLLSVGLTFLALSLVACGGGGGGGGGLTAGITTDFTALAADQRGYTDGVYMIQSGQPDGSVKNSAVSFMAAQKANDLGKSLSAPGRMIARSAQRQPFRFAGSATGVVDGYVYNLAASLFFYNAQGQQVKFESINEYTPETTIRAMFASVNRMTMSLSGTVGPLQITWTGNAQPISLTLSQDGSILSFTCSNVTESGTIQEGANAIRYAATYSERGSVSTEYGTVLSDQSTGTFSMTLPQGWSVAGQFAGSNYSGYVLKDGVPQGNFSGNDNAIALQDFESGQSYTIQ